MQYLKIAYARVHIVCTLLNVYKAIQLLSQISECSWKGEHKASQSASCK